MEERCQTCGRRIVHPSGPVTSDILLIGDFPDWYDTIKAKAFAVGYKKNGRPVLRAGDILRDLLTANSIRPERCKMMNVWEHELPSKDNPCDEDKHTTKCLAALLHSKYVLLMGTPAVRLLLPDANAAEWSGLEILSPELPQGVRAMGSVKMSTGFAATGEVQNAIKRFAEMINEDK